MRLYQIPDSTSISLINDHDNKIEFTTFLDDGKILMKIGHRYALFDSDGIFMDEIEFNFKDEQPSEAINSSIVQKPIPSHQRMNLLCMSRNLQYFLFEDRQKKTYQVFQIVNRSKKGSSLMMDSMLRKKGSKSKIYEDIYDFAPVYEINIFESNLIKERFGIENSEEGYAQVQTLIENGKIQPKVRVNGKVVFISNFHEEYSTSIEIWGCIFDITEEVKNFK
jgi:hypothetical protein